MRGIDNIHSLVEHNTEPLFQILPSKTDSLIFGKKLDIYYIYSQRVDSASALIIFSVIGHDPL